MSAAWHAEGPYFRFETDLVTGRLLTAGQYQGMRELVHRPTGVQIAAGETLIMLDSRGAQAQKSTIVMVASLFVSGLVFFATQARWIIEMIAVRVGDEHDEVGRHRLARREDRVRVQVALARGCGPQPIRFAARRDVERVRYQGKEVRVHGWFRRAPTPYLEINQLEVVDGSLPSRNCYTSWASLFGYVFLLALGIAGAVIGWIAG